MEEATYRVKAVADSWKNLVVSVPGSKSVTNRALLMAALSDGPCHLTGVLFSDDSRYFLSSLKSLGFDVKWNENTKEAWVVGCFGRIPLSYATINVGSAGTAARFLTAMVALSDGTYRVDCSAQMEKRPMRPLFECLSRMGAEFTFLKEEWHLPVLVKGCGVKSASVDLDISKSTQFLSALLLTSPMLAAGLEIGITSEKTDGSYIRITRKMMEQCGVTVRFDGQRYHVNGGVTYHGGEYAIEPDVSAACYFYAMAAVTGRRTVVSGVHRGLMQGDMKFLDVLVEMGCMLEETSEGIAITGPARGELRGVQCNMNDFSDQALTLAAIAPFANSPTDILGIGHIRAQECDRLHAMGCALHNMGVEFSTTDSSIHIEPLTKEQQEALEKEGVDRIIHTFDDHRVAMSFAISGLRLDGVVIEDPMCCRKTFENYFEILDRIIQSVS